MDVISRYNSMRGMERLNPPVNVYDFSNIKTESHPGNTDS